MSETAKRRIAAIGRELGASSGTIPPIIKVAPESNGPRVAGKVVIITGMRGCVTCPLVFP